MRNVKEGKEKQKGRKKTKKGWQRKIERKKTQKRRETEK